MKKCYYAHTMLSYNSTIEATDIQLLKDLGFEVINPNTVEFILGCKKYVKMYGKSRVMEYFKNIVSHCDLIAFRGLPDGKILSGIAVELGAALQKGMPIIELPCSLEERMIYYPETRQFLTEIGFYKLT